MKVITFALILFLTAGIAYAKEFKVMEKAGDYKVEFKIDNLRVGTNIATIEIKDASGSYVTDAKIRIDYSMPEGIDWPPMHFTTDAETEGHGYKAKMKIPMPGTWSTWVNIIQGEKTSSMKTFLHTYSQ